jgi:ATP-dependent DNA helicase RecG
MWSQCITEINPYFAPETENKYGSTDYNSNNSPMNTNEIQNLLNDIESDRVERTISTTNTDKFGQAICAFANDLPNHQQPGYLFLGVEDDGTVKGVNITDDLLKNVAAIRTDGNIQPQPSMTEEKVSLEEGDIVMVKVEPAVFPPVRYKGRIWIRIGLRKGVANENDEHILMEKRRSNVTSFDSSPCLNATINDLDLQKFKHYYLPKAMHDEELESDRRDVKLQLSALVFSILDTTARQMRECCFSQRISAGLFLARMFNMCVFQGKTVQGIF